MKSTWRVLDTTSQRELWTGPARSARGAVQKFRQTPISDLYPYIVAVATPKKETNEQQPTSSQTRKQLS